MKVRIFFEPLTIDVPDDEIPLIVGDVDIAGLTLHIEENWDRFVDPSTPIIGALKPVNFTDGAIFPTEPKI
jgi:hypothetical protein